MGDEVTKDPTAGMSADQKYKFQAAVKLIRRTGAEEFQVRWSDDEVPTVWMAVARYSGDRGEAAAALVPIDAVMRLCEQLIDGGTCSHCKRLSGFEPTSLDMMPLNKMVCWYQWDPEMKTFRRGCE